MFLAWYESQEKRIPEEPVLCKIVDCIQMVENNKEDTCDSVRKIEADLTKLMSPFGVFKSENQARSKLFTLWDYYGAMVTSLLQFLKAERTGNWKLHLHSIQHCSNATSLFCSGQAELNVCSLLTCLSCRHAATGTNTPRCVQRVWCRKSFHKSFRAAHFTGFSRHGPGAVGQCQF